MFGRYFVIIWYSKCNVKPFLESYQYILKEKFVSYFVFNADFQNCDCISVKLLNKPKIT